MAASSRNREGLDPDPFWYKSGVIYEVHVRSFHDGNGDGCGDFAGLTDKLDYLKDLGGRRFGSCRSIPLRSRMTAMTSPTIVRFTRSMAR